jgi:hypothetical protein
MTADMSDPQIIIHAPHVESFEGMVSVLRRTGAVGLGGRKFAITGPVNVSQVAALLDLLVWRDSGTEGNQFTVQFEPAPVVEDDPDDEELHRWWARELYGVQLEDPRDDADW